MYTRPAAAIRWYRKRFASYVAAGARQIRVIGEVPQPELGARWDWWARYESAINVAYDDFPLWSMCAYDTRVASEPVLRDVACTHPRFAEPGDRHVGNPAFAEPRVFLTQDRLPVPDPLQAGPPTAELSEPTPAQARHAVRAADQGLRPEDISDLVVAVSETVTNAARHGRSPVRLRVWSAPDRILVTVTDAGAGPKDPGAEPAAGVRAVDVP
ncbi:sensor histidine kinase [Actinoplanes sp. TFC3]|uniref:sensor histidine kinase n=1 Tax=Actinoplanes sp. TFC3 TaxID=1710355 RepID=UPI000A624E5A|nr:sensor histidine kinase [Actinoplanes sp. TFC3]